MAEKEESMNTIGTDYAYRAATKTRRASMPQLSEDGRVFARFWSLYFFGASLVVVGMAAYGYFEAVWRVVVG
jgi:hypothetical protein